MKRIVLRVETHALASVSQPSCRRLSTPGPFSQRRAARYAPARPPSSSARRPCASGRGSATFHPIRTELRPTRCRRPLPRLPSAPILTSTNNSRLRCSAASARARSFFLSRLRICGAMDALSSAPYAAWNVCSDDAGTWAVCERAAETARWHHDGYHDLPVRKTWSRHACTESARRARRCRWRPCSRRPRHRTYLPSARKERAHPRRLCESQMALEGPAKAVVRRVRNCCQRWTRGKPTSSAVTSSCGIVGVEVR